MTNNKSNKPDGFQEITNSIISYIEENDSLPWRSKSWRQDFFPVNAKGVNYNGGNFWILAAISMMEEHNASRWMTYKQAQELGGQVRKGEKGMKVVFYKSYEKDEKDQGGDDNKIVRFAKWYRVFNVSQIDGLPEDFYNLPPDNNNLPIDSAEDFLNLLPGKIVHEDGVPCFRPRSDTIRMPGMNRFEEAESYYKTLAHERIHWTGHPDRLDRFPIAVNELTKEERAAEELVAELGAAYLLPRLGLQPLIDEEHAPYIKSWLACLKNDKKYIFKAATKAQKAVEYLTSIVERNAQSKAA